MAIDLSGVRAKIERAWEHHNALKAEVLPVLDGESYPLEMSAELDDDSGYHIFRVKAIPSDWVLRMSIILGDIAHNCRSALDQLYWQLVIHHGGRPKKIPERKPGSNSRSSSIPKGSPTWLP